MSVKTNPGPEEAEEVFRLHAEICKVLSNPLRLRVIDILRGGELKVSSISESLHAGMGNLSQHLALMKKTKILTSRKEGQEVYYRLRNPKILKAFDTLREILFEEIRREGELIKGMK